MNKATKSLLWTLGGIAAGAWLYSKRAHSYAQVPMELRSPLLRLRSPTAGRAALPLMRLAGRIEASCVEGVTLEAHQIPAADGTPITVYLYRPDGVADGSPVVLHSHGGAMVAGSARSFHKHISGYARDLGMVVAATEYRLSPEYRFPIPLEDVHAAHAWLLEHGTTLGIDPTRLAVIGESAGGCLTAALCQRLLDEGKPLPRLQVLIYPMLDDRTTLRAPVNHQGEFFCTPGVVLFGWQSYLGYTPSLEQLPPDYAAPARREELSGLPPAWIGVGSLDLFLEESCIYARRLDQAGVPTTFELVQGGFHIFDLVKQSAPQSVRFRTAYLDAIRKALS